MQKRHIVYNIQGMGLDVVSSPLNTTMAYSIKNMRLTPTKDSNALELTTERGTKPIYADGDNFPFDVTILGYCTLQQYLVLFLKGEKQYDNQNHWIGGPDYIYRLEQDDNGDYVSKCLFEGDLNFSEDSNIEATSYYENENVLKVYWADGVNQPRIINIHGKEDEDSFIVGVDTPTFPKTNFTSIHTEFDFLLEVFQNNPNSLPSSARIKAKKLYTGGNFTSGVIQYAYSLYSMNSQETPLLDITSLNYITHYDRGGAPNEQCGCSFEITIENKNLKNEFDYIRVYSIQRNSLNGTPLARVVADVHFNEEITIIDDGNGGYDIDYNQLQYQRLPIHPLTLTLKDNVLFVGNYDIDKSIEDMTHLYQFNIQIDTENWWPYDSDWDDHYGVEVYDPNDISVYPWKNQLDTESAGVKTFKYGETYKLGVQFQDKYGNWSQPYFIKDVKQDKFPIINNGKLLKPIFTCDIDDITNNLQLWEKDLYVRIRPVVSFPSLTERSVLCQGVLNPTVFNITDRINKTCYALSSWFFRPFKPNRFIFDSNDKYGTLQFGAVVNYTHYDSLNSSMDIGGEILGMYYDKDISNPAGELQLWEAQRPYVLNWFNDNDFNASNYKNFYFIDQSILTFNSPDIEYNANNFSFENINNYNVSLVGIIPINSNTGTYNIIASSPLPYNIKIKETYNWLGQTTSRYKLRGENMPEGFYKYQLINTNNDTGLSASGIISALNCWFDDISDIVKNSNTVIPAQWNDLQSAVSYYVYPWNRQYLNNYNHGNDLFKDEPSNNEWGILQSTESSKLTNKTLANFRYSLDNKIFTNNLQIPKTYTLSVEQIIKHYNNNINRLNNNKIYCGNINLYITYNGLFTGMIYDYAMGLPFTAYLGPDNRSGYPITVQDIKFIQDSSDLEHNNDYEYRIKNGKPREFCPFDTTNVYGQDNNESYFVSPNNCSSDPILISYKSSPHLVFKLLNEGNIQSVIPALEKLINGLYLPYLNECLLPLLYLPWSDTNYDDDILSCKLKILLNTGITNTSSYLFLSQIRNVNLNSSYLNKWNTDNPNNPYLENESNLYLRNWLPAGKALLIPSDSGSGVEIAWIEGDTYYQRYDCVKTKPYSDESYQSVIEILSFMVESNINLDGRYDKNRGILDYTIISDDNFNLFNDVYNQENNFFTYHILDPAKFNIEEFRNDILWSAKKISGESIDQWTKLSSVNQLQLDGNKGYIKALRKFNDNIYCFQDHAVSRIRFNDRTAIATESGESLQLAYTNYVDGYEYVNSDIGCQYGISCCETENGIFFIDNDIPGIYKMSYNEYGNANVRSLTKERFMQRWFENDGNVKKTRVFFDKPVNEILTVCNNDIDNDVDGYCISFSCDMNSFQQFIDYKKAKYVFTHNNWPIAITDTNGLLELWKLRNGSFVSFFGQYRRPYGLKIVASPPRTNDGLILDCIYDSLSYKADVFVGPNGDFDPDTYQPNESFDTLEVSSIYLTGEQTLLEYTDQPSHLMSNLRKKFGSWFARIPKFNDISLLQGRYNKERMRGSKLMINLMKDKPKITNHKLILKELSVDCFY